MIIDLSIIIPMYNEEENIANCINSILCQIEKNIEIIIIDDGSLDNSYEIANQIIASHENIFLYQIKNSGVSSARNFGLSKAKGEYVAFSDADDQLKPGAIKEILNLISLEPDLIFFCSYTINKNKYRMNKYIKKNLAIVELLKFKLPTSVWACVYRKKIVSGINFSDDIYFFEDFLFNLMVLEKSEKIYVSDYKHYMYFQNENSVNQSKINDRIMSCINIYSKILNGFKSKFIQKNALYPHSYILVSLIRKISKNRNNLYIKTVRYNIWKNIFKIIFSIKTTIFQKFLLLIFLISPKSTITLISFLKKNRK